MQKAVQVLVCGFSLFSITTATGMSPKWQIATQAPTKPDPYLDAKINQLVEKAALILQKGANHRLEKAKRKDYKYAYDLCNEALTQGCCPDTKAKAIYLLALMYYFGYGIQKSTAHAHQLFYQVITQEDNNTMRGKGFFWLGFIYYACYTKHPNIPCMGSYNTNAISREYFEKAIEYGKDNPAEEQAAKDCLNSLTQFENKYKEYSIASSRK